MKPKLSELKKEFEEFVRDGIPSEGFIVNHFHFSIPKEIENFFDAVADDIYNMHISLEAYISQKEKADFAIEYANQRPPITNSELVTNIEEFIIEEIKYEKFPKFFLSLNIYFDVSKLSEASKEIIRANKNFFTEYVEDTLYITLHLEIKDFSFYFDYYGKVL